MKIKGPDFSRPGKPQQATGMRTDDMALLDELEAELAASDEVEEVEDQREEKQQLPDDEIDLLRGFIAHGIGRLGFSEKTNTWWAFDEGLWRTAPASRKHYPMLLLKEYMDQLEKQAKKPKGLVNLRRAMSHVVDQAALERRLKIDEQQFDTDPWLLSFKNGVLDLRTGKLEPHQPRHMISRQIPFDYNPSAKAPQFSAFLRSVCKERKDLVLWLRRALGYTLTGDTSMQVFFLLMGQASNGKGVLLNLLRKLLGDYATAVSPALLHSAYGSNPNAASEALMALRGRRLYICTELKKGASFDEAFVKQVVGGDAIAARGNYGAQVVFQPVGKLWVSTNDDPPISFGNAAMFRRIVVVPFDRVFRGDDVDEALEEHLAEEAEGILALLCESAILFAKKRKLRASKVIGEAQSAFQARSDTVKNWVDACCRAVDGETTPSGEAYKSYKKHMKALERTAQSPQAFKRGLEALRFSHEKKRTGNYFNGLKIVE